MNAVEQRLANWTELLFPSISIGGLMSRNVVAYKWKAPFRMVQPIALGRVDGDPKLAAHPNETPTRAPETSCGAPSTLRS